MIVGLQLTRRRLVLLVICFFGLFLSGELVIEYLHNQQALLSLEHTESYSTLGLQYERISYERMRLHEAKTFLQKKQQELREKEDRFLSQLKSEDAKRKEKLHFREDDNVATNICEELTGRSSSGDKRKMTKTKTKVFLAIFSHSLNSERRALFRDTVFRRRPSEAEIVVRFVISDRELLLNETVRKQVLKERDAMGDILTFDMDQSYIEDYLLNGKRLKLFLEHLYANYDFEFVVKAEDLAFVRIPALMEALDELPKRWVYWGYFVSGQRVVTDYTHPYADPHYVEVNDRYACYATPAGFGISKDLVQYIVLSSIEFRVWGYDDAQLGTWLSPLNISYVDVGATAIWRSEGCVGCSCLETSTAIVHPVSNDTFFMKLFEESEKGRMCQMPLFTKSIIDGRSKRTGLQSMSTNNTLLVLSILGIFFFCFIIFALVIARALKSSSEEVHSDEDSDNE